MKRLTLIPATILGIFAANIVPAAEGVPWAGAIYSQVGGKAELPEPIRAHLKMDAAGRDGVADIGQPFEETDVHIDDLPSRQLLGAGRSGNKWLVILDHGGYSRMFEAYLFDGARLEKHWALLWRRNQTFASVVTNDEWKLSE
jgi:hypothetical protein